MHPSRLLLSLGFLFFFSNVLPQNLKELPPGYYVVVGAYAPSQEKKAQRYVDVLRNKGHQAEYGYNSTRKYYFVYVNYFSTFNESIHKMEDTRQSGTFTDAWVRIVSGSSSTQAADVVDSALPPGVARVNSMVTFHSTPTTDGVSVNHDAESSQDTEIATTSTTAGSKDVLFNIFNARNRRPIPGDVSVIDTDRARLITKAKGNERASLPDPKNNSGQITLICDVFGYRKLQQEINYPLSLADTVRDFIELQDSILVVNFDLVRYQKGDIATLYNVYFYNDACVMLPESKYELNSLLELLKENPRYRIRLHGHTNGGHHGKIVSMGPEKNFFTLTGSAEGVGTARQLSYNRAGIVKEYMTSQGIDPSRMEIKGWGGRRPLYDKHSANARRNVRVEVEILED